MTFHFNHRPVFDIGVAAEEYSKKDGVSVKYVATTELSLRSEIVFDVFYRDSPHPVYGNKYFGLCNNMGQVYIVGADNIEYLEFDMILHNGKYHYSRSRHDFLSVGPYCIDGGRCYTRLGGPEIPETHGFKVKGGEFVNA